MTYHPNHLLVKAHFFEYFWYPIIKQIGKAIGIKVTKTTVAQGISKAVPVIGGVISGGLNFASMLPMANRLQKALDSAAFNYTEEDLERDILEIENIVVDADETSTEENDIKAKLLDGGKKATEKISGLFAKKTPVAEKTTNNNNEIIETIKELSELKDSGIITQEEFDSKKSDLLAKL